MDKTSISFIFNIDSDVKKSDIIWCRKDVNISTVTGKFTVDKSKFRYLYYSDINKYLPICSRNNCNNVVESRTKRLCGAHNIREESASTIQRSQIVWKKKNISSVIEPKLVIDLDGFKYMYYADINRYLSICSDKECNNTINRKSDRLCAKHAGNRLTCHFIDSKGIKCPHRASFNYEGEKSGKFCKGHIQPLMIDVVHKIKCAHPECSVRSSYNYAHESSPKFCATHREKDMIDVVNELCHFDGCNKLPSYNYINENKAIYCGSHRLNDMIFVKNPNMICRDEHCTKFASYNYENESMALYCKTHSLLDMINIRKVNQQCAHPTCTTRASFNYPNEKKGRYCTSHKEDGMIDFYTNKCIYDGCTTRASFNYSDQNTRLYCGKHKKDGMVNISESRICIYSNCDTGASFNYPNEKEAKYCYNHKLENMINICRKKCIFPECSRRAYYGKLFEEKIHCLKHRSNNEYLKTKPKCIFQNCKNKPYYIDSNNNNGYPKRCEEHKEEGDINIVERECSKCHLQWFIPSDRTECNDCYEHFINRSYRVKEERVKQLLQYNNIEYHIHDQTIEDGCSNRRPDFVIDKGQYQIILEVDENQHNRYENNCEDIRMKQIYFDLGGYPVVFIRYNPDDYLNFEKFKITHDPNREKYLIDFIKSFDNLTEWNCPLTVLYLFYDGWNNIPVRVELDPYSS